MREKIQNVHTTLSHQQKFTLAPVVEKRDWRTVSVFSADITKVSCAQNRKLHQLLKKLMLILQHRHKRASSKILRKS